MVEKIRIFHINLLRSINFLTLTRIQAKARARATARDGLASRNFGN